MTDTTTAVLARFLRRPACMLALWGALAAPAWCAPNGIVAMCVTDGRCLAPDDDLPRRDGFALRLTLVQPPLSLLDGGARSSLLQQPGQQPGSSPFQAYGRALLGPAQEVLPSALLDTSAPSSQSAVELGVNAMLAGQVAQAEEHFRKALDLPGGTRGAEFRAAALANQAVALALLGRYGQARPLLVAALPRFRELPPPTVPPEQEARFRAMEPAVARQPDAVAAGQARRYLWLTFLQDDPSFGPLGELRTLLNLANLDGQLGQLAQADQWLQQAARLADQLAARDGLAKLPRWVASERAVLLRRAARVAEADAQAKLVTSGAAFDVLDIPLWGSRPFALGASAGPVATEARMSMADMLAQAKRGDDSTSGRAAEAPAVRLAPSRSADAALSRLQAVTDDAERRGDLVAASTASRRMAMLAFVSGQPERERAALAQSARLAAKQGGLDEAIYLAKRAVNLAQQLRRELEGLERSARQRYLADKRQGYADLAGWLARRGRLAEAELALRLLKEDEGQQLARGAATPRGRMPYTHEESALLARQGAVLDELRGLCRERPCGSIGITDDDARDLTARLRLQLEGVSQIVIEDEAVDDPQMKAVRAAAAKPPKRRTAAEAALVGQAAADRDAMMAGLDDAAASIRALRKQSQFLSQPLAPEDARRADDAIASLEKMRDRVRKVAAFLDGEVATAPARLTADAFAGLLSVGLTATQQTAAALQRLEALDAQRERLDAEAARALADARPGAAPSFLPADGPLLESSRNLLASLPAGTAALYYLVGDERLDVLLATSQGRRAFALPIGRANLDALVRTLRQALASPARDPVPAARALYDAVLAPLENALGEVGARTLMLSLDGTLRYVPFAALHDGRGWLAERYATSVYTTAAPGALSRAPAPRWRIAGFGSSAGGQGLSALPGVRAELEGIVRDGRRPGQGLLPGTLVMDRDFTAAALQATLGRQADRQNVVHIASHFVFRGGDPAASFLLLGDGSRLSLADLAGSGWRFDHVDLVTLSACETALAGDDHFGQEVEGLSTVLQGQGAAAVLATLWPVADDSTAAFMRSFYAVREAQQLTRAMALRVAQQRLIRGDAAAVGDAAPRGASREPQADAASPRPATAAAGGRSRAHPYYWAPFVLMGNWL